MSRPPVEIQPGDTVSLRKPHPCGENRWLITRVSMEIGLRCAGCDRVVLLHRDEFERRYKRHLT